MGFLSKLFGHSTTHNPPPVKTEEKWLANSSKKKITTFEKYLSEDISTKAQTQLLLLEEMITHKILGTHLNTEELLLDLKSICQDMLKIDEASSLLKDEGDKLRQDITLFTRAVAEASNKFKLSPDWEGKKPPLMALQQSLTARRDAYNIKEEKINQTVALICERYNKFCRTIDDNITHS